MGLLWVSFLMVKSSALLLAKRKLFTEERDFDATRPQAVASEKIAFGFVGDYTKMKINIKSETPEDFKAWSQNLGHEGVLTTFYSYGEVQPQRQSDIFQRLKKSAEVSKSEGPEFMKEATAGQLLEMLKSKLGEDSRNL